MPNETDFYKLLEILQKNIEKIEEISNLKDDKLSDSVKELEKTFKTSLGFLESLIKKEINRSDDLEKSLQDVDSWRAEIQSLIADLTVQIEQLTNTNYNQLSNLLIENMKSLRKMVESSYRVKEKKAIDWTKVLLAIVSAGGVLSLILEKLL
ncbi:hypothetical protein [Oceanotoga phage vB_OteS-UFV02]